MPGHWVGAADRGRFPKDWGERRLKRRAIAGGRCEWIKGNGARCEVQCPDDGECDHWGDRYDHRVESLRWLCKTHHGRKSSAQGNAAKRPGPNKNRPLEAHPASSTTTTGIAAALDVARRLTLGEASPSRRSSDGPP
jgi:hypothetical protein